jgi:hypothetical protein
MTEKAVMVGMIVFYAVLIGICLFMLYQIYNAIMELLREMLADAFEDGRNYAREKENRKKTIAPVRLREEPSFQEVMAEMRKRRKATNGRKRKADGRLSQNAARTGSGKKSDRSGNGTKHS